MVAFTDIHMAKNVRSSGPKKAAGKAVKKITKKVSKKKAITVKTVKTVKTAKKAKAAVKSSPKPQPAPLRKLPKKAAATKVRAGVKTASARQRMATAAAQIKAVRQAEEKQATQFEKAAKLFQGRKFAQARPLLEKVSGGPNVGLTHRAGIYLQICQEQMARGKPRFKTADEHYNYAVQLMNDGQLEDAETYLKKALRMDRKAAHLQYALSVLKVLSGDLSAAFEALKKSIQSDPQNRILALRDADLAVVAKDEPFKSLLAQ